LEGAITDVVFSPDSASVAASTLKAASLFNIGTSVETKMSGVGLPETMAFSSDGTLMAIGCLQLSGEGAGPTIPLYLFDAKTGERLSAIWFNHPLNINSLGFGDNHTLFINADEATEVWRVEDLLSGTLMSDDDLSGTGFGANDQIRFIASESIAHRTLPGGKLMRLNPVNHELAIVDAATIQLIDPKTGSEMAALQLPFFDHFADGLIDELTFSPTASLLAFSVDNAIQLLDTSTAIPQALLTGHQLDITALAFSPDGKFLASGSGRFPYYGDPYGEDGGVRVWNVSAKSLKTVLHGYNQPVLLLRFSADGNILFTSYNFGAAGGNAGLWNLSTNSYIENYNSIRFIAFYPTSTL
jgi:WD40 repeat protein